MPIYGDGTQSRDFTYVANVVEATILAADAADSSGAILNVATGRSVTVNELAEAVGAVLGLAVETEFRESRPGDVSHSWADVREAERVLCWRPHVTLEEGLRLTADGLA